MRIELPQDSMILMLARLGSGDEDPQDVCSLASGVFWGILNFLYIIGCGIIYAAGWVLFTLLKALAAGLAVTSILAWLIPPLEHFVDQAVQQHIFLLLLFYVCFGGLLWFSSHKTSAWLERRKHSQEPGEAEHSSVQIWRWVDQKMKQACRPLTIR